MNPDPDLTHALRPSAANQDTRTFEPDLDEALADAFGPDPTPGGWSQPPLLRDDRSDDVLLVQPSSLEMPRHSGERYQLLGEIARGGMGVIIKGRDPDLGRDLAFKVLKAELTGRPVAEQRFVEEAQVGGQLQHPGIVPVYELGRFADGRPYFTMKLVRGKTLAALLASRSSLDAERGRFLKVFEQVAQTIAYAHSKGVIHRDLKPANVMVGSFGEVQVMDWGLAKVLNDGGIADEEGGGPTTLDERPHEANEEPRVIHTTRSGPGSGSDTVAGSVLGTPAYMPPEQACGETDKLDERADVFGLGGILCVILTGQPPRGGEAAEVARRMATGGELHEAFARLDECGADLELVSLCKQCLALERESRPRHGGEVADAITAHLQSVEDRAYRAEVERAGAEVRAAEQRKRRRVQAALGMTLTAAVGLVGFGLWWQERQSARESADRVARQSRTVASVAAALDDARARGEEAWGMADEPEKMKVATDLAMAAVRRAEGFSAAGDSPPEVERELAVVRAATASLDRHMELFVAADLALRVHDIGPDGRPDGARTTQRLAEAFRNFGWNPVRTPAATIAQEIASSRARNKILGFLCDWEFQSAGDDKRQIREVIRYTRLRAGGTLAHWQEVVDGGDTIALVDFASGPDILGMGPELICALGRNLGDAHQSDARQKLLRRAISRYPNHVWINFDLMRACRSDNPPRFVEGVHYAAAALSTRPDSTLILVNLGGCLLGAGAPEHAATIFRKALTLAPTYIEAHYGLAISLDRVGDRVGAISSYREITRLAPNNSQVHADLAKALLASGDLDESIVESREAIRLDPSSANGHYVLALAFQKQGAYDEAAATFRTLAKLVPANAVAYSGIARSCDRLHSLANRLSSFKMVSEKPATAVEGAELASICITPRYKEYALAVRLYTEAFAADSRLLAPTTGHRYNAACAAVRLAAGDDLGTSVEIDEGNRLRNQARGWLAAELAGLRPYTNSAQPGPRQWAADRLAQWATDPDLASVREPERRVGYPKDQRQAWEQLWAEFETVRRATIPLPGPMLGQ